MCITGVQCALLVYNVHYWCTMCITCVQCALLVYNVHYWCTMCITGVQCALLVYNVHYWCTMCITGAGLQCAMYCDPPLLSLVTTVMSYDVSMKRGARSPERLP